jgi:hypothetical protein
MPSVYDDWGVMHRDVRWWHVRGALLVALIVCMALATLWQLSGGTP